MNVLIVYDSFYGNTLKVAEMYAKELSEKGASANIIHVDKVTMPEWENADLLIFGSPTRAFRSTPKMQAFLKNKDFSFENRKAFVFDTRIDPADIKSKMLKWMMSKFGYATTDMKKLLIKRKAEIVQEPCGYAVISSEGPLKPDVAYQVVICVVKLLEQPN